MELVARSSSTS